MGASETQPSTLRTSDRTIGAPGLAHGSARDQPGHVTAARGFAGPDGSRAWPVEDIGDLGSLTSRIRIHYPERFSVALRIRGVERTGETRDAREQG